MVSPFFFASLVQLMARKEKTKWRGIKKIVKYHGRRFTEGFFPRVALGFGPFGHLEVCLRCRSMQKSLQASRNLFAELNNNYILYLGQLPSGTSFE